MTHVWKGVNPLSGFLTVDEAARLAKRTVEQVRHLLRKQEIPEAERVGRTWLLPVSAVETIQQKSAHRP